MHPGFWPGAIQARPVAAPSRRAQLEIIGEAVRRLEKDDPETAARIADYRRIIAFRNILIHGYDAIDPAIVWSAIVDDLTPLLKDVQTLLDTLS